MIRCGIDASSSCTGIAIFDDKTLVFYSKIRPENDLGFRNNACQIVDKILPVLDKYKVEKIIMEDVPEYANKGSRGKPLLRMLCTLGAVQGVFYLKIAYESGYNINYKDVWAWRMKLGFLLGNNRKREEMKQKAIDYANSKFGLDLFFKRDSKTMKNDDDIAEAICICWTDIMEDPNFEHKHFGRG